MKSLVLVLFTVVSSVKYLLYDVNPGEGFNLRRDVYIRVSNLVKGMNEKGNKYKLVLPPWGNIGYHWGHGEQKIKWGHFFNLDAMRKHVDLIEFEEFLNSEENIEHVWYLQAYAEGWGEKFEEKYDDRDCISSPPYHSHLSPEPRILGNFFNYGDSVYASNFKCVSVQGMASVLVPKLNSEVEKSVFLDRAETLLHDKFGQFDYWHSRRSMQFSRTMFDFAMNLEKSFSLDSDVQYLGEEWEHHQPLISPTSNYIAAHLRRRDFVRYGGTSNRNVPSIEKACEYLLDVANDQKVDKIYIATDGNSEEKKKMKNILGEKLKIFEPNKSEMKTLRKGGVAIIDQIICSHAKYFIGTQESTFSFRIHEERTILGFSQESTYNHFCNDGVEECGKPTYWPIPYKKSDALY